MKRVDGQVRGYYLDARVAGAYDVETALAGAVVVDDLPFYTRLAHDAFRAGDAVLELGCGTGRVTVPMALTDAAVTGLDSSPAMLEIARRKAIEAGIRVVWVEGDMARFELGERFGLAVIPFRSLQLLTDDRDLSACLEAVHLHLAPEGLLAFNLASAVLPRAFARAAPLPERAPALSESERGLAMRYYDASEIEEALTAAGFRLDALHGWFDGRPFTDESSEMVWLARRC